MYGGGFFLDPSRSILLSILYLSLSLFYLYSILILFLSLFYLIPIPLSLFLSLFFKANFVSVLAGPFPCDEEDMTISIPPFNGALQSINVDNTVISIPSSDGELQKYGLTVDTSRGTRIKIKKEVLQVKFYSSLFSVKPLLNN